MMGLIGAGNNPMVGMTVAVAVSIEEVAKAGEFQAESNLASASHKAQHEVSARPFTNLSENELKMKFELS